MRVFRKRVRNGRPSVQPRPTGAVLGATFRWLKLDEQARSFAAMSAYAAAARIAGRAMAENTRGERLRGAILFVRCQTAAWAHNVHLSKDLILRQMRKQPGGDGVNDIRCNVGPVEDVPAWERPEPVSVAGVAPRHEPPAEVTAALGDVADEELRQRLAALYAKLGSREK